MHQIRVKTRMRTPKVIYAIRTHTWPPRRLSRTWTPRLCAPRARYTYLWVDKSARIESPTLWERRPPRNDHWHPGTPRHTDGCTDLCCGFMVCVCVCGRCRVCGCGQIVWETLALSRLGSCVRRLFGNWWCACLMGGCGRDLDVKVFSWKFVCSLNEEVLIVEV